MASNMHNIRLLRFLIVLIIVVLTIFIYTSYSSTQTLAPPPMRSALLLAYSLSNNRSTANELDSSAANYDANKIPNGNLNDAAHKTFAYHANLPHASLGGSHGNEMVFIKKLVHHREPTIDVNAIDDDGNDAGSEGQGIDDRPSANAGGGEENGGDEMALERFNNNNNDLMQEEQYVQAVDNTLASDKVEIPHTALQDTSSGNKNLAEDNENGEALPPSVIMTIKGAGAETAAEKANDNSKPSSAAVAASPHAPKVTSTTKKVQKMEADPTQGIPTKQIYESGHMNDEIDINQICPNKGDKLKLLILITSAQTHAEARLAIRQTWGHFGTRRDVSTAFILGRTTNATVSTTLTQENMIYGDLIRGHFIDSYNNLTLKTLSSLEWVDKNCPKTKYILKTDDDMFINVPKLLQFLDAHAKDKRVIYGRLAKKWKPIRNKKSKYYISTGQFGAAVFPPFTTGPAYVMTSDIVHDLYVNSLEQLYLKLEDVFTTGIVAQKLGVKRVHDNMFLNRRIAFNPCNIRKAISVHMIKPNEQFDLWKKLLDQTTKCK